MPLTGTNKHCQQCIHDCKQWAQVKVVFCPTFKSTQQKESRSKNSHTLQHKVTLPLDQRIPTG